ncbi:MAG: MBL fold metallo-hydrolase [Oscillospiraceae bacterium]
MIHTHDTRKIFAALLGLVLCALLPGCKAPTAEPALKPEPEPEQETIAPMQVSLLKVGKADVIVLQTGEEILVIDTGEEEDGEELVTFLTNLGLDHIDTLIITHFDRDHVGGADTVVEQLKIGQVILPAYQGSSTEYLDFLSALDDRDIVPKKLTEPLELSFGAASVLIEPPLSYETPDNGIETDNNFSLITTVVHGENRFVFMGDAEKQRIRQWLDGDTAAPCDFLKVPHHGVYNSALRDLVAATTPEFAVICSSDKHPADTQTLELFKGQNAQVLETRHGDITVISDGTGIEIHQKSE